MPASLWRRPGRCGGERRAIGPDSGGTRTLSALLSERSKGREEEGSVCVSKLRQNEKNKRRCNIMSNK